jgi:hypothetical protein
MANAVDSARHPPPALSATSAGGGQSGGTVAIRYMLRIEMME